MGKDNKKKDWPIYAIFGLFFILILFQFLQVGIYYDDYGYYCLNYCVPTVHYGHLYSFAELFSFLREHYFAVSGRLPYFFLWLSLYKIGGLLLVRIICAVIVTGIMFFLYRISAKDKPLWQKIVAALLIILSFGLISQRLHQHGTYWNVAFFLYYTPILFLLVFSLLFKQLQKKDNSGKAAAWKIVFAGICIFLSSWAFESWTVAVSAICMVLFCVGCIKKRGFAFREFLFLLLAVAGTVILFCSPGIMERARTTNGDVGLFLRIRSSIALAFSILYADYMRFILIAVFGSSAMLVFAGLKRKKNIIDLLCALILLPALALEIISSSLLGRITLGSVPGLVFGGLVAMAALIPPLRFFLTEKKTEAIIPVLTGTFSVLALAGVASFPERVIIPFVFCAFVIIPEGVNEFSGVLSEKNKKTGVIFAFLLVVILSVPSLWNAAHIFNGYRVNHKVNAINEKILETSAEEIQNGKNIESIYLMKYEESKEQYASTMLYQQESTWFKNMITGYYGIPDEVEIIYK